MLRGVQANVAQRRALSQLYQAKGVAPGTVDAVSDITLWPKPSCIPAKGVGPKAQTWAWPAQIRARSCACNPTLWDFRKNAEHSMCELTTGWILEKCPKSSVCTALTITWILERTQNTWCANLPLGGFLEVPRVILHLYIFWPKRDLWQSPEGSGMLMGDFLGEGSNASSTYNAQKGVACS